MHMRSRARDKPGETDPLQENSQIKYCTFNPLTAGTEFTRFYVNIKGIIICNIWISTMA